MRSHADFLFAEILLTAQIGITQNDIWLYHLLRIADCLLPKSVCASIATWSDNAVETSQAVGPQSAPDLPNAARLKRAVIPVIHSL